ncbi:hypothetical protein KI387_036722, partial [Taxus chinensis]
CRKSLPRWTIKLPATSTSETGPDGPPDDGYSWRKYGQKDILGSQHPRSYYRCTHKTDMDCRAKKQVQRAVNDSSYFEVTYIGSHCCHTAPTNIYGCTSAIPTIPNALVFGGSQSESYAGHGLLGTISGEEVDKAYDFGKDAMFSYNPDSIHMTEYYRFGSMVQQDATTAKNLIDFLPRHEKEQELGHVPLFGIMDVMDSGETESASVTSQMQTSKCGVAGETSSPMLELDIEDIIFPT